MQFVEHDVKLVVVLAHEVVAGQEGHSVYVEVVLVHVELVFYVSFVLVFASNYKTHKAEAQSQVLLEQDPVVVFMVKSVAFVYHEVQIFRRLI